MNAELRNQKSETEIKELDISLPEVQKELILNQDQTLMQPIAEFAAKVFACPADPKFPEIQPRALLVGGFVRDALLGQHPKDADIEILGVSPKRLEELLDQLFPGQVDRVGQQFGILKVKVSEGVEFDVSIPRRESKSGVGHKGFTTMSDPGMSIAEAARRRDFSWNALAADILTGEVFDSTNGIADLQANQLRVTDPETFIDDPLRVMRAVQFAARLGFSVEPKSFELMKGMVERGELAELPPERITAELEKLLLKSNKPSVGFELAKDLGILEKHFPELFALVGVQQDPKWHPEGDVWVHTMMVIDVAAKLIRQPERNFTNQEELEVMLGALCHDLGKASTTKIIDGRIRALGHEEAGKEPTEQFCKRLSFGKNTVAAAVKTGEEHLKPVSLYSEFAGRQSMDEKAYANAVRRLLKRIQPVSWKVLVAVSESDIRGRTTPEAKSDSFLPGETMAQVIQAHQLDVESIANLVGGADIIRIAEELGLEVRPGPQFGQLIGAIEEMRDRQEVESKQQALEALKNLIISGPI